MWQVTELADGYAVVYPLNDVREHLLVGGLCGCDPDIFVLDCGGIVLSHNSYDRREDEEMRQEIGELG